MSKSVTFYRLEIAIENVRGGHVISARAFHDPSDPHANTSSPDIVAETRRVVAGEHGTPKANRAVRKALKELLADAYPVPTRAQQPSDVPGQTVLAGVGN